MGIQREINEQLDRISSAGSGSHSFSIETAGGKLDCDVSQADSIGCAVDRLRWRTDQLNNATADRLRQTGQRFADRARYLLEPLAPVECDAEAGVLRMRSAPPSRDESGSRYYEVDVQRDEGVIFSRYAARPGQPRESAPAHFTRETLGRLADDIIESTRGD
ncbi:MAG: hypothetical protein KDA47_20145 [Planctomycetales bacterium]|nr:hypothetical protein [Planctomycetales bacterium]